MAPAVSLDATVSLVFFQTGKAEVRDPMVKLPLRVLAALGVLTGLSLLLSWGVTRFLPAPRQNMRREIVLRFPHSRCGSGRFVGGLPPAPSPSLCATSELRAEQKRVLQEVENDQGDTRPTDKALAAFLGGKALRIWLPAFQEATEVKAADPDLWSDLSAAHLAAFAESKDAFHLILALQAADHALNLSESHPEARFNMEASLKALSLDEASLRARWSGAERRGTATPPPLGCLSRVDPVMKAIEAFAPEINNPSDKGSLERASAGLRRLEDAQGASLTPAQSARIHWFLGLISAKSGQLQQALDDYDRSLALYSQLGQVDRVASLHSLRAEALGYQGRYLEAWRERVQTLRIAQSPGSYRALHNVLFDSAWAAARSQWSSLALRLQGLALEDAGHHSDTVGIVELLTRRARVLVEERRISEAREDLREARRWIPALSEARERIRSALEIESIESDLDPRKPLETLLGGDLTRVPETMLPDVLSARARNLRGSAHLRESRSAYGKAIEQVLKQAGNQVSWQRRRAFLNRHRSTLDELLILDAKLGDEKSALESVLLWLGVEASGKATPLSPSVPREGGLLVLRSVPKGILGWLQTPRGTRFFHCPRQALDSLRKRLAQGDAPGVGDRDLEQLSRELLGPIGNELLGLRTLLVLADRGLREIPFAALRNPASRSDYLVEDTEISVVVPVERRVRTASRPAFGLLAVGNPSSPTALDEQLFDLPGAEREVEDIARLYGKAVQLLVGEPATKGAVVALLQNSSMAHLAMHAKEGEEGAVLFLAPSRGALDNGILEGSDIEGLRLAGLRLVVLAACSSAVEGSPEENFGSLVEPFLAAGTGAVVASLWPVGDRSTPELWPVFYRELRKGVAPESALRAAQLACLKDKQHPSLANPAYWAGFAVFHGDLPMKGE